MYWLIDSLLELLRMKFEITNFAEISKTAVMYETFGPFCVKIMKRVNSRYRWSSKDWFMPAMISQDTGMKLHKERSSHVYGVVKVIFFGNKSDRKWIWDVAINNCKFTVFGERFYSWFYHFTSKTRYLYDGNSEKPQMAVYSSVSIKWTREQVVFTSFINKQKRV